MFMFSPASQVKKTIKNVSDTVVQIGKYRVDPEGTVALSLDEIGMYVKSSQFTNGILQYVNSVRNDEVASSIDGPDGFKLLTGQSHATPGTTVDVAHGLGFAPKHAFVQLGNAYVTAITATNITVASTAASQDFTVVVSVY